LVGNQEAESGDDPLHCCPMTFDFNNKRDPQTKEGASPKSNKVGKDRSNRQKVRLTTRKAGKRSISDWAMKWIVKFTSYCT
jgi:hypothetical protein